MNRLQAGQGNAGAQPERLRKPAIPMWKGCRPHFVDTALCHLNQLWRSFFIFYHRDAAQSDKLRRGSAARSGNFYRVCLSRLYFIPKMPSLFIKL